MSFEQKLQKEKNTSNFRGGCLKRLRFAFVTLAQKRWVAQKWFSIKELLFETSTGRMKRVVLKFKCSEMSETWAFFVICTVTRFRQNKKLAFQKNCRYWDIAGRSHVWLLRNIALKNIVAKVLSRRLAKVLDLSKTSLTTCLFNAIEHVGKSEEIRQRTTNRGKSGGSK